MLVTGPGYARADHPAARAAIGQLASTLLSSLKPILAELVPIIGQLGTALGTVLAAALQALVPLLPPLVDILKATLVVIVPLVPVIAVPGQHRRGAGPRDHAAGRRVGPLVGCDRDTDRRDRGQRRRDDRRASSATLAWAAAQWVLNAALNGNPIGIVIIQALIALGVALVAAWEKSATFRSIVIGTWQAIYTTVAPIIAAIVSTVTSTFNTIRSVVGSVSSGSEPTSARLCRCSPRS